jgi:hypothetical protein
VHSSSTTGSRRCSQYRWTCRVRAAPGVAAALASCIGSHAGLAAAQAAAAAGRRTDAAGLVAACRHGLQAGPASQGAAHGLLRAAPARHVAQPPRLRAAPGACWRTRGGRRAWHRRWRLWGWRLCRAGAAAAAAGGCWCRRCSCQQQRDLWHAAQRLQLAGAVRQRLPDVLRRQVRGRAGPPAGGCVHTRRCRAGCLDEPRAMVPPCTAGHDTTSATLTVLLWHLAQSPHVVQKLLDEQQRLVQQHGPEISWEVLEGMEYARACAKEALRMTPPVGAVFRRAAGDFDVRATQGRRLCGCSGSTLCCAATSRAHAERPLAVRGPRAEHRLPPAACKRRPRRRRCLRVTTTAQQLLTASAGPPWACRWGVSRCAAAPW